MKVTASNCRRPSLIIIVQTLYIQSIPKIVALPSLHLIKLDVVKVSQCGSWGARMIFEPSRRL